jgi:hypothetical protein
MLARPPRKAAAIIPALLACVAAICAGYLPAAAGSSKQADFSLSVQVAYGKQTGPESLRELLENEIIRRIAEEGCFRAVGRFEPEAEAPDADLLVRLVIQDVEDRTDYETSLAYRDRQDQAPDEKKKLIASLEVEAALQMVTLPESAEVRRRDFRTTRSYRPEYNEDGSYEVKLRMLEHLAEESRRFACKGAGKKLAKEVEQARAASGPR